MNPSAPGRRIPFVATLIVLCAVATMIGLGVWQLERRQWKEALLVRYADALADDAAVTWPTDPRQYASTYFRRSTVTCASDVKLSAMAGRNAAGEAGWVQIAECRNDGGALAAVQLGWSRDPAPVAFAGGAFAGRIAPYGSSVRLVADPPMAGLEANAAPDPREIPNNHLAYAVQWFFFAATALIIYVIALRRRTRDRASQPTA
ncbi:SURF1 family cytochrome oxidase biogenesis protein [Croceicoccus sp. BE223]|uniref:SURF1 family cytochrome oxidase biogenesis protein n=1 Tax=Croceicoccus sp. BE223 TaxID=2817716 RepID=UPI00285C5D38|nr:SURF1 family cytochrome oxidase biogenesis protein [Croceicoccus sp. BE223]MDR7102441.1 surfeit locus 1 family protein [Croceicoccus sp. BE223]